MAEEENMSGNTTQSYKEYKLKYLSGIKESLQLDEERPDLPSP